METYRILKGVELGENCLIEDYCIIGVPPRGSEEGELKTVIGTKSHLRSHSVVYAGNQIGENFQTGNKVNIRELNRIGDNVSIGTLSVVEHHVDIGNNVRIHGQVFIPEYSILEDNVWVGPTVVMTNAKYPLSPGVKEHLKGPMIKRDAKIGANATILPGIVIGENAMVGAGSVVVKDVPDGAVVVGNPARVIKTVKELPY
ncbi:MAG: transferase [Aliifodinibius sp.]|nr:N-acetyltransferase [Fodinibius sp.]NIV14821.1 transferase [Fodinibius sp.]NIY28700.1 transferase [Fodinibius sp.]